MPTTLMTTRMTTTRMPVFYLRRFSLLSSCPRRSSPESSCLRRFLFWSSCPWRFPPWSSCPRRSPSWSSCPQRSPPLSFCPRRCPPWSSCPPCYPPGLLNRGPSLFCSSPRFHLSLFSFLRSARSSGVSHQDLDAHSGHVIPPPPSPMRVFRATSQPLEEDYAVQRSISPLGTSRKQSCLDMDDANRNKLRCQPVAASREEETVRLIFSCCGCTPEVKLNVEWQMALLVKKINMDMTDAMVTLAALH